jgi:1-acyl-sn-glycerol-3-phosphate acyltransferase
MMHPCRIRLKVLAPIETAGFSEVDGHVRLRKQVKEQMVAALAAMRGEEH